MRRTPNRLRASIRSSRSLPCLVPRRPLCWQALSILRAPVLRRIPAYNRPMQVMRAMQVTQAMPFWLFLNIPHHHHRSLSRAPHCMQRTCPSPRGVLGTAQVTPLRPGAHPHARDIRIVLIPSFFLSTPRTAASCWQELAGAGPLASRRSLSWVAGSRSIQPRDQAELP